MQVTRNDHTLELLHYSAERDYCISRPESWTAPPPLVVDTPLHEEMVALADELQRYLKCELAPFKCPRQIYVLPDDAPQMPVGL